MTAGKYARVDVTMHWMGEATKKILIDSKKILM